MDSTTNALNWFEIPVTDMNRAVTFYEAIFGIKIELQNMMGFEMGMFPGEMGNGKVSGCLCKSEMHTPSMTGVVLYLNANPDMTNVVEKIEGAGGKVIIPKTVISPEVGHMAFFIDTEGNRLGLHSQH